MSLQQRLKHSSSFRQPNEKESLSRNVPADMLTILLIISMFLIVKAVIANCYYNAAGLFFAMQIPLNGLVTPAAIGGAPATLVIMFSLCYF
jgi:hypothetical protein